MFFSGGCGTVVSGWEDGGTMGWIKRMEDVTFTSCRSLPWTWVQLGGTRSRRLYVVTLETGRDGCRRKGYKVVGYSQTMAPASAEASRDSN